MTAEGREFQTAGTVQLKDRLSMSLCLNDTSTNGTADDRSHRVPLCALMCWQRYTGADICHILNVSTASLLEMCCSISNQCSSFISGCTCDRPRLSAWWMILAALFCACCSLWMVPSTLSASSSFQQLGVKVQVRDRGVPDDVCSSVGTLQHASAARPC